jgi:hypothetical protein
MVTASGCDKQIPFGNDRKKGRAEVASAFHLGCSGLLFLDGAMAGAGSREPFAVVVLDWILITASPMRKQIPLRLRSGE